MDRIRRRGDEYRRLKQRRLNGEPPTANSISERMFSPDECSDAIHSQCAKKIRKYGGVSTNVGLAVYLNDYWPDKRYLPAIFETAASEARKFFHPVYLVKHEYIHPGINHASDVGRA